MSRWIWLIVCAVPAVMAVYGPANEDTWKPIEEETGVPPAMVVDKELGELNGIHYYYSSIKQKTWIGAMEYCRTKSQYLLTINGPTDLNFLLDAIRKKPGTPEQEQRIWLAATDLQVENQFVWFYTGARTYNGFKVDISDRWTKGNESCLLMLVKMREWRSYDYFCDGFENIHKNVQREFPLICQDAVPIKRF